MQPKNSNEITLVKKAREGKDAFEQLIRRYQHDVFRIVRLYTHNDYDAADLAQETWIKVYQSLGKLKDDGRFAGWLSTIARNTAKNWLKSRGYRDSAVTDIIEEQQLQRTEMSMLRQQQLISEIRATIDSLSAKYRQVVYDFYICGYSAAQISERLSLPISTVTGRLQEARRQLREEFATMIKASEIQQKFAPTHFVENVMKQVGQIPTPAPVGTLTETIGRLLSKPVAPTIGIATLIVVATIGLIWVNLADRPQENSTLTNSFWRKRADMATPRVALATAVVNGKIYAIGGRTGHVVPVTTPKPIRGRLHRICRRQGGICPPAS